MNSTSTSSSMSLSAVSTQIRELYETSGLSVEQVAEQLDLTVEVVKTSLLQHSREYNRRLKEEEEVFTDQDFQNAKQAISSCLFAEDESTRFRAAKFVINERKGRHDTIASLKKGATFNVLILNEQLQRAKQALLKSKNGEHKTIDVESSEETKEEKQVA